MAGRGQIPNPELRRYDDVERDSAIYLIEAGSYVKVGRARVAKCRLRELHTYLSRHGMQPGRFTVFPKHDNGVTLYQAEGDCIRALRGLAENAEGRREYFTGISFDEAVAVVGQIVGHTPSLAASIPSRLIQEAGVPLS